MDDAYADLRQRLEDVAEALTDRSIERLRASLASGEDRVPDEEKELTRARRSIEKAIAILRRLDEGPAADDGW